MYRYALINTMPATDGLTIGQVMSRHHTYGAAAEAESKHQRLVRRNNPGGNAYLPTLVVELEDGVQARKGTYLHREDVREGDGGIVGAYS